MKQTKFKSLYLAQPITSKKIGKKRRFDNGKPAIQHKKVLKARKTK